MSIEALSLQGEGGARGTSGVCDGSFQPGASPGQAQDPVTQVLS